MGTWDSSIFADDTAMDVKAEFEDAVAEGMSVKQATKYVLENFEDVLDDEDEAPIVYLALAALQLDRGSVQNNIKKKALAIIESGQGLERWEEAGEDELKDRLKVLGELKDKLLG